MTKTALDLSEWLGYLTKPEVMFLKGLASTENEKAKADGRKLVIVNIGAGAGTSALAFVEACPDAVRYTVDISPGGPLGGMEGELNAFNDAGKGHLLPIQILSDSSAAGRAWTGGEVDIVFVDGNHTPEFVEADIDAWLPHVRPGGLMVFHDYGGIFWDHVKYTVDTKMKKYNSDVKVVDSMAAFRIIENE